MNYSDITINDPNPIKRYLQRSRLNLALKLYPKVSYSQNVLDFGGGDGELCRRLRELDENSNFICFEPAQSMYEQAKIKIPKGNKIELIKEINAVHNESIDVVFSLEVFEHLPEKELNIALNRIYSILKPNGYFIVGVPNELYIAAFYKGLFRMIRRYGDYDASLSNILRCVLGVPPKNRPIDEISPGMNFHFHHLGFDHRRLLNSLEDKFILNRKTFSPLKILGSLAGNEVYYILRKK